MGSLPPFHWGDRADDGHGCAARALVTVAWLWAGVNCAYVYLLHAGRFAYRAESSSILFAIAGVLYAVTGRDVRLETDWSRKVTAIVLTIATVAWAACVLPFAQAPFLSDDYVFLARYSAWADVWSAAQFFRPLFGAVFVAAAKVGASGSTPFHLLAYVLHGLSTAAIYVLVRRVFRSRAVAAMSATGFLLNPLQPEVLLWVSGLQDGLWSCFVLWAACVHTAKPMPTRGTIVGTACLGACALLSKETAVCFPFVLLVVDWASGRLRPTANWFLTYAMFLAEVVGYLALRHHFAFATDASVWITPTRYALKQFLVTPYKMFVFPWNVAEWHLGPVAQGIVGLVALTLAAGVIRLGPKRTLTGPALILCSTLPVGGYFFVGSDLVSARYLYFPAFGCALLGSMAACALMRRRTSTAVLAVGLIVCAAAALARNATPWAVAGSLMRDVDAVMRKDGRPDAAFARWRSVDAIVWRAGLPDNYKGVYLFRNGWFEYQARFGRPDASLR